MNFAITSGVIPTAKKVVIYGIEGIGKSTFASQFPDPLYIDTEGSTKHMNVKRLPSPDTWQTLIEEIRFVAAERPCKTLVIDTADWAEKLAVPYVLAKQGGGDPRITSLESFGFGKGFTYLEEEFRGFIAELDKVIASGINVVVTAHAQIRTFTEPDGFGQYDRYELKLSKKCSPILKEWADILIFANYKTLIVKDTNGKSKGQGGERVMYLTHTPAWDAKNRFGLPDSMPFEYSAIASIITEMSAPAPVKEEKPKAKKTKKEQKAQPEALDLNSQKVDIYESEDPIESEALKTLLDNLHKKGIKESELEFYVSKTGVVPEGMPVRSYDDELLNYLNANIGAVYSKIVEIRDPLG